MKGTCLTARMTAVLLSTAFALGAALPASAGEWYDDFDWAQYLPIDLGKPAVGSLPTAMEQHFWQSRGDVFSTDCIPEESATPCTAHRRAVDYAQRWADYVLPTCEKLPGRLRKKSTKRQAHAVMVQMYISLSKTAWIDTEALAADVWSRSRVLNKWCPNLQTTDTSDIKN